ncbi:MAG: hypothetical protein P1P82_16415 [Bacteroidales bacterium]|nr:hypothetical protein [Bacteroidales bacterium]MDT8432962.1 hypothetical protein [Bacteroidales bacterium]
MPIDQLDFRYGAIAFNYGVAEMKTKLEFEIENDEVRPEFDVLKPYFSKVLKKKHIEAEIFAEFENNLVVSQQAKSSDLDKINREIIESVKFRFIEQGNYGKQFLYGSADKFLDFDKVQEEQIGTPFYNSEEQFLNELIKNKKVKHYRQLRYLASRHESTTLKLRFVQNPFSFVFLLSGPGQYHVVLETLDTEEATYIWHLNKNKQLLRQKLQSIDQDLNVIRNKGRQAFLEKQRENFSRLIHDYTDDRKGFIIWKDKLEEKLL